jgi:hypothetical protein
MSERKGVKLKLAPICTTNGALNLFKDIVERAHETRTAAYLLAKHYILCRLRRTEPIPKDVKMLFRNVVSSLGKKKPRAVEPDPRPDLRALLASDFPRSEDGQPFSVNTENLTSNWTLYEACTYETSIANHIKANFSKCLFSFVEAELCLSRKDPFELATIKDTVARLINNQDTPELDPFPNIYALPSRPQLEPTEEEEQLEDTSDLPSIALQNHVNDAPMEYLAPMLYMCSRLESHGYNTFYSVLPLVKSHTPGHTLIDTNTLLNNIPAELRQGRTKESFRDAWKTTGKRGKEAREQHENQRLVDGQTALWSLVLDMSRVPRNGERSQLRFDNMIHTDGYACTLFLRRRSDQLDGTGRHFGKVAKRSKVDSLPASFLARNLKVIAVDPGKNNLIYCLDDATPRYDEEHRKLIDKGKTFRYTRAQRDFEMGKKRRRSKAEEYKARLCPEAKEWEERLRGHSSRTFDVSSFIRFIDMFLASRSALKPFYFRLAHRRDRFESYRLRQKTESRMMSSFKRCMQCKGRSARDSTLIAFGNGSRCNLKNSVPGPSSRLRNLFVRHRFQVLDIHEAYTSKRCFNCKDQHAENGPHRYHLPGAPEQRPAQVWGVRRCCRCDRPWSRDYHACLNIAVLARALIHGLRRPEYLCR